MRLAGVLWHTDIAGPWISSEIFVQGCRRACPDCFNPQTWDEHGGDEMNWPVVVDRLVQNVPYKRLTISGGEPMLQAWELYLLCSALKARSKDWKIICYTGYTWEELRSDRTDVGLYSQSLLSSIDILVDGMFKKELALPIEPFKFVGSSNQRIIDVQKSLRKDRVILWKESWLSKLKRERHDGHVGTGGVYID
jgi:anaerobic ribonucleoside-triphosphate reductase activating protein